METHHCPIFFFCKNCLVGSCDDNVIWNHIMSGRCTEKRVYERTIGFAIASDLHFQPTDEGVHLQKLRETVCFLVKLFILLIFTAYGIRQAAHLYKQEFRQVS